MNYLRTTMNHIRILVLGAYFAASASAFAQQCNTPAQMQQAKLRIESLLNEHVSISTDYIRTLRQQSTVLELVNKCRAEDDVIGGIFSALTLQEPKCDPIIREYNTLIAKGESQKGQIEMILSSLNTLTILYKSAFPNICTN